MAINVHKLRHDACLFCPKPIEMKTSTQTYESSGTSDHYYDYTRYDLHVVHSPLEQVFCFDISMEKKGEENCWRRKSKDHVGIIALVDSEFVRLKDVCDKRIEVARDRLTNQISLDIFSDNRKDYENAAIKGVISEMYRRMSPNKEEMYLFISELMFEEGDGRTTNTEKALEISKKYPGHWLRERTDPSYLKSHLECWPYDSFGERIVCYRDFYKRIHRPHLEGVSKKYSELFKKFKKMSIKISPHR